VSYRPPVADEAIWRAAYECEFVDEAHALLPYDLLLARVDDTVSYHLDAETLSKARNLYAGYDVGRKRDLSVLIVVERRGKELLWRGAVELRTSPFERSSRTARSMIYFERIGPDQWWS
jgi:phage FluMu gp28-like protein